MRERDTTGLKIAWVALAASGFAITAATAFVGTAMAAPVHGPVKVDVRVKPHGVVQIHTSWGADYVAYDRGVQAVWVGTSNQFAEQRARGFPRPRLPSETAIPAAELDVTSATELSVDVAGIQYAHMGISVMFDVNARATHRPALPRGQSYVAMAFTPSLTPAPLILLVDMRNGHVSKSYWSGGADVWTSEEFFVPVQSLTHRMMILFFRSYGRPSALVVRSIVWTTYRDFRTGHDVSPHEARRLVALDPSLTRTFREADVDRKRYDEEVNSGQSAPVSQPARREIPTDVPVAATEAYAGKWLIAAPKARLQLDVLASTADRERGLSGWASLPAHSGALFVFPADARHVFWTKNVPFDVDLVFVAKDGTVTGVSTLRGSAYGVSDALVPRVTGFGSYVIALPGGEAVRDGFIQGIHVEPFPQVDGNRP
jgi:uncharacterized membrane protein (UPF0127 family)